MTTKHTKNYYETINDQELDYIEYHTGSQTHIKSVFGIPTVKRLRRSSGLMVRRLGTTTDLHKSIYKDKDLEAISLMSIVEGSNDDKIVGIVYRVEFKELRLKLKAQEVDFYKYLGTYYTYEEAYEVRNNFIEAEKLRESFPFYFKNYTKCITEAPLRYKGINAGNTHSYKKVEKQPSVKDIKRSVQKLTDYTFPENTDFSKLYNDTKELWYNHNTKRWEVYLNNDLTKNIGGHKIIQIAQLARDLYKKTGKNIFLIESTITHLEKDYMQVTLERFEELYLQGIIEYNPPVYNHKFILKRDNITPLQYKTLEGVKTHA